MKRFWIFILLALLLSACNALPGSRPTDAYPQPGAQSASYPDSSGTSETYPGSDYPGPDVYSLPEGYPAPNVEPDIPTPTVTPDTTKGNIKGTLLRNNQGVPEAILYLAEIIKDDKGNDRLASFNPFESPSTTTNTEGVFIFPNVAPGKYQLVLYTVVNAYFLYYPGEKKEIIVTVKENQTIDVGKLNYDSLPLPEN